MESDTYVCTYVEEDNKVKLIVLHKADKIM